MNINLKRLAVSGLINISTVTIGIIFGYVIKCALL